MAELSSVQCITRASFNPTSLTGTYQPLNGPNGCSDDVKILEIYNGGLVGIDISLDGVTDHLYWPPGSTLIVDFQTNHADNAVDASGTKYMRKGQIIWGKTTENAALLFISGFR